MVYRNGCGGCPMYKGHSVLTQRPNSVSRALLWFKQQWTLDRNTPHAKRLPSVSEAKVTLWQTLMRSIPIACSWSSH